MTIWLGQKCFQIGRFKFGWRVEPDGTTSSVNDPVSPNAQDAGAKSSNYSDAPIRGYILAISNLATFLIVGSIRIAANTTKDRNLIAFAAYIVGSIPITLFLNTRDDKGLPPAIPYLRYATLHLNQKMTPVALARSLSYLALTLLRCPPPDRPATDAYYEASVALGRASHIWTPANDLHRWISCMSMKAEAEHFYGDVIGAQRTHLTIISAAKRNWRHYVTANLDYICWLLNVVQEAGDTQTFYVEARNYLQRFDFAHPGAAPHKLTVSERIKVANYYLALFEAAQVAEDGVIADRQIAHLEGLRSRRKASKPQAYQISRLRYEHQLIHSTHASDLDGITSAQSSLRALSKAADPIANGNSESDLVGTKLSLAISYLNKSILGQSEADMARALTTIFGIENHPKARSQHVVEAIKSHLVEFINNQVWTNRVAHESEGFVATPGKKKCAIAELTFRQGRSGDALTIAAEVINTQSSALPLRTARDIGQEFDEMNDALRAGVLVGRITGDASRYPFTLMDLDKLAGTISYETAPLLWLENRMIALEAYYWWIRSEWSPAIYEAAGNLMLSLTNLDWQKHAYHHIECMRIWIDLQTAFCVSDKFNDLVPDEVRRGFLAQAHATYEQVFNGGLAIFYGTGNEEQKQLIAHQLSRLSEAVSLSFLRSGDVEKAFLTASRGRAINASISFLEKRLEDDAARDVRVARTAWREAVDRERHVAEAILASVDADSSRLSELGDEIDRLGEETRSNFLGYQEALKDVSISSLLDTSFEEVKNSLDDETIVVLIYVGELASYCVFFDGTTPELTQSNVIPIEGLNKADLEILLHGPNGWFQSYKAFREVITDNQSSEADLEVYLSTWSQKVEDVSKYLGEKVVQPIYDTLTLYYPDRPFYDVRFVAPGHLSVLPFSSALLVDEGGARKQRLVEKFAYSFWPSLDAMTSTTSVHHDSTGVSDEVLVVSPDNTLPRNFPINAYLAKDRHAVLAGLRKSHYSCFYCHGHFDEALAGSSGLILPDDSTLTVNDVRNVPEVSNRIVFLASCESGMINTRRLPDEFVGLPVSFMEAGVSCVCSSLWLAHVEVAQRAAERFFVLHLQDGLKPEFAMRQVILELAGLAERTGDSCYAGSEFTDVSFWSCFTVTGGVN